MEEVKCSGRSSRSYWKVWKSSFGHFESCALLLTMRKVDVVDFLKNYFFALEQFIKTFKGFLFSWLLWMLKCIVMRCRWKVVIHLLIGSVVNYELSNYASRYKVFSSLKLLLEHSHIVFKQSCKSSVMRCFCCHPAHTTKFKNVLIRQVRRQCKDKVKIRETESLSPDCDCERKDFWTVQVRHLTHKK